MKTIDLTSREPSLEELLALARAQAGVLLTKHGQPVAQILPLSGKPLQRVAPLHPGAWEVRADFDEPLTEEFLLGRA
jgi:antitoxin (DNA-binding transcriptional repressor) of toxin-antitoxin stability system